jgi:hypothetical protein
MVSKKAYPVNQILQDTAAARGVLARLWPIVRLPSQATPTGASFGTVDYADSTGRSRVINSDDGNTYCKGHQLYLASGQSITSTGGSTITGLQVPVSASTYYIDGVVDWVQGGVASVQNFWFNGPSVTFIRVPYFFALWGSGVSNGVGAATHIGSGGGASMISPAFANGTSISLHFKGVVQFSASGFFGVSASEQNAGDSFSITANSFFMIFPA